MRTGALELDGLDTHQSGLVVAVAACGWMAMLGLRTAGDHAHGGGERQPPLSAEGQARQAQQQTENKARATRLQGRETDT